VLSVLKNGNTEPADVDIIASHGQTYSFTGFSAS